MNAAFQQEHALKVKHATALLLVTFERNGGHVTRAHFQKLCSRMGVAVQVMQAILEIDFGLRVMRRTHKKLGNDVMVMGKAPDRTIA